MASTNIHWADHAAEKIIAEKGDKDSYTVASGITPSGVIHMGNFREVITVDLVKRALEKKGKKVRFIYSWDDFDRFRKVPVNMPKQEMLAEQIGKPLIDIEDPFGTEESYARHHEVAFEVPAKAMGIEPEYLYQGKINRAGTYVEHIKTALEKTEIIKGILNTYRKEPLAEEWLPIEVYDDESGKDDTPNKVYEGEYSISYDHNGNRKTVNFKEHPNLKLKWRIDWPMRWVHEDVDFEPGGKDHGSAGGSFDTGKQIVKEVFGRDAPSFIRYEWIGIKGGKQFASSKGLVITPKEMLEVYEPEMVRYLFAGTRPNAEFSISFDADVIKIYDEFDKLEREYFDPEVNKGEEFETQRRIYELSAVHEVPKTLPFQPSFRHLTNILLAYELNVDKALEYYKDDVKSDFDKERLQLRANCAKNWLEKHAPDEFKFSVQESVPEGLDVPEEFKAAFKECSTILKSRDDWTDTELHEAFYHMVKGKDLNIKEFFKYAYQIIIDRTKGPQLANFILTIGKERVITLFDSL